jgi:phage repressor protein C with HTH and peptisase S24 domain
VTRLNPRRARRSVRVVAVEGASMNPTLRSGDACLVWWGAPARPGDVVIARLPARGLGVKRAAMVDADGSVWLRSDNPRAGTDSATFGAVAGSDVLGRVLVRYWPRPTVLRRLS